MNMLEMLRSLVGPEKYDELMNAATNFSNSLQTIAVNLAAINSQLRVIDARLSSLETRLYKDAAENDKDVRAG